MSAFGADSLPPIQEPAPSLLSKLRGGSERLAELGWQGRIKRLEKLKEAIQSNLPEIQQALFEDLGKPRPESLASEIFSLYAEIAEVRRSLKLWMRPRRVRNPPAFRLSRSHIHFQPRGVILVISPWNYPFQLALGPVISAIAAGNSVCLKPSELSPATSQILLKVIRQVFPEDEVLVVLGGPEVARGLTKLPFDHLIFTGGTQTGRDVLGAASTHLTSCTLELGGKSPAILTRNAHLRRSAERIVWGKFLNAGQTCVAPDYVLVPREMETAFLEELVRALQTRWPSGVAGLPPADYCRIINRRHYDRLEGLFREALSQGAELVSGGQGNPAELWFEPTILRAVPSGCRLMQEEIFGPMLPVLCYDQLDQALSRVRSLPDPLALYVFSRDKGSAQQIVDNTRAGDTVINDVLVHFANPGLPFGGVGASGFGKLHGRAGFDACSHQRSVMRQGLVSPASWISPPYTKRVRRLIQWFLKLA